MLKKFKKMPKSAHQTRGVCVVVLPNKVQLHITVGLGCRGQEVIRQLSQLLGIRDLLLFGLSVQRSMYKDHIFLDLKKKLTTYFPEPWKRYTLPDSMVLHLRVQYYIRNGQQIAEEKVLSLYFADLKNRVLSSLCYGQEGLYFQLAAYALQADLGDWKEEVEPYFIPQEYFPPWILIRRGCDYVVQHTPDLHRELRGMSTHDACMLFIEEACSLSDVPLTFYKMSKTKKEKRASVLLGLALTGLHIYDIETASEKYQLLYEFAWPSIECLKFQGRRFEVRADALAGEILVMYTQSVMHSQHILKHMSNSHYVHLHTKNSVKQLQRKGIKQQREVCIRDSTDPDSEDSEDELPPMKSYLDKVRQNHVDTMATAWGISTNGRLKTGEHVEIELCVDEPEEMFVDDPEEVIQLTEFLEDFTVEMKQVLRWRACSLSLDQGTESVENLHVMHSINSHEEHANSLLANKHRQQDIIL